MQSLWTIIVPLKDPEHAKTRLGSGRAGLARAMARDTVAACAATGGVDRAVVVTDDPAWRGRTGVSVVPDPGGGLNAALAAAAADVQGPVAVVLGDLPALRPEDLGAFLSFAARHSRSLVSDASGVGTTALACLDPDGLDPRFGEGSRAAHHQSGARECSLGSIVRLRRDVDTRVDLEDALRLGVGDHTLAAVRS